MRKIAVIALGAFALLAVAAQDGVVLRKQLTANSTEIYNVEMKSVNSTPMGDASVDGTMKMTYKYGQIDKDGKADIEIITSDIKLKLGGVAEMAEGMMGEMPKTTTVKGKIDDRNRLTDMKAVGAAAQMAMLTGSSASNSNQSVAFPEKGVKVGDIWEIVMPANKAAGMSETKLTGKLVSEKTVDGVVTYVVSMYGTIPIKMNMAEMMKDAPGGAAAGMPADLMITGKVDLKMDSVIDKVTGRTLETIMTAKSVGAISGESLPMVIDTAGTTTVKITLAK
ncbi:MAG: hypothetical protein WAO58_07470 [Fimbriimonadaceae bacterium]